MFLIPRINGLFVNMTDNAEPSAPAWRSDEWANMMGFCSMIPMLDTMAIVRVDLHAL